MHQDERRRRDGPCVGLTRVVQVDAEPGRRFPIRFSRCSREGQVVWLNQLAGFVNQAHVRQLVLLSVGVFNIADRAPDLGHAGSDTRVTAATDPRSPGHGLA